MSCLLLGGLLRCVVGGPRGRADRIGMYSKARVGVARLARACALIGRLLRRRMRLTVLVVVLWLWFLLCLCLVRGASSAVIARLLAQRATWAQQTLPAALPLLSEALLGVQPLQPTLRSTIQDGALSTIGR